MSSRPREGSAESRGKVIGFPEPQFSMLNAGGLAGTPIGEKALPGIIAGAADLGPGRGADRDGGGRDLRDIGWLGGAALHPHSAIGVRSGGTDRP